MSTQTTEVHWASYSSLSKHRSCPQAWYYSSVRGLRALKEEPACERDFGSWWHALRAVEAMVRGRALGSLRSIPREITTTDEGPKFEASQVVVFDVFVAMGEWWENQHPDYREAWMDRLGREAPEHLAETFERWVDTWHSEIEHEEPLAVEMGWGRNLPTWSTWGKADEVRDPFTRLVGYVDEVYRDKRRNVIVVRDHKTSKALDTQTTLDDMMDSQLQLYAWGASPEVTSWGLGKIEATAYDRTRMVAPKPPLLTLSGRLRETAGNPNVGQTDLRTYVEWAAGPDGQGVEYPGTGKNPVPGRYVAEESVIEKLGTPAARSVWFQRTLTPLNSNVVRSHLRAAIDSALDQQNTRARSEATGEAGRNLGYSCRWCEFQALCRAEMVGGPGGEFLLSDFNLAERGKRGR